MKTQKSEHHPAWMALTGLGASVATYLLGAYILSGFGLLAWVLYLGYCACVEIAVLRGTCCLEPRKRESPALWPPTANPTSIKQQ
jgi:hypothetical protein